MRVESGGREVLPAIDAAPGRASFPCKPDTDFKDGWPAADNVDKMIGGVDRPSLSGNCGAAVHVEASDNLVAGMARSALDNALAVSLTK